MARIFATFCFAIIALSAQAGEWRLRLDDQILSLDQLQDLTAGTALTFYDDGVSQFSVGGSYSYSYADNGGISFGVFEVKRNGTVCIDFRNGFSRCDMYVRNGELLMLVTEQGGRFPIRVEIGVRQ